MKLTSEVEFVQLRKRKGFRRDDVCRIAYQLEPKGTIRFKRLVDHCWHDKLSMQFSNFFGDGSTLPQWQRRTCMGVGF